jgi:uncharacterized membrane protein
MSLFQEDTPMIDPRKRTIERNLTDAERNIALFGGGSLVAYGLLRKNWTGVALAAFGTGLVVAGITGKSSAGRPIRTMLKGTGKNVSIPYESGIHVDETVRINRSAADLYQFWRNLKNLPVLMRHIDSVEIIDERLSRWKAKGPVGLSIQWNAEIINDIQDKIIAWRSIKGSMVDCAGSVRFEPALNGRTDVIVTLQYHPPAGEIGVALAKLFGQDPTKHIREDLRRFRELMEKGVVSVSETPRTDHPKLGKEQTESMAEEVAASEHSFPASDPPGTW